MSVRNINFDDKKIKKSDFYKNKKINSMNKIDVHKILLSKKESYGTKNLFKYFIGYNDNDVIIICDNDVITMLRVRLPEMTAYARKFDKNATISFTFNGKQLLKNYNQVWEKVEKLMKIDFENKSVYSMMINT